MKRLGLIIVIALMLTVGGVYATFNYAQNDVPSVNAMLNKTIAAADTDGEKGTIAIDVETFLFKIDDKGLLAGGPKTLTTGYTSQGNVKVTFTPAQGADEEVVNGGVNLKLEISFANNKYNGTDVFITTTDYTAGGVVLGKGTKNALGVFEYTVNLGQYLAVNEFSLPTLTDYNSFSDFFTHPDNAKVTITVSEVK